MSEVKTGRTLGGRLRSRAANQTDTVSMPFVSYNVLAPWTEDDMRAGLAQTFGPAELEAVLDYDHSSGLRRANVASVVDSAGLAVLVEVERRVVNDALRRAAQLGAAFEVELGWRNDPHTEWGSAVLWRASHFEQVAKAVGSLAVGRHTTQTYNAVLLKHVGSGTLLCVVAVHLKAGGMELEDVRAEQARMAVVGAERLTRSALGEASARRMPMVVAGDFNSDRRHRAALVCRQMSRLGFSDAGANTSLRTIKHGGDAIFDYVYTRNLTASSYGVRDDTTQHISPNLTEGSDHLPVFCTLNLEVKAP